MDRYFQYKPEPSRVLLAHGQIVEGSYFLSDGVIEMALGETQPCEFEVCLMQDGVCRATVYFQFDSALGRSVRLDLEKKLRRAKRLLGKDRVWQRDLEIELDSCVQWKGDALAEGFWFVFLVRAYSVQRDEKTESNTEIFALSNLPISNHYSPEISLAHDELAFDEKVESEALTAAIKKVIELTSEGTEPAKNLLQLAEAIAKAKKEELVSLAPVAHRKVIPINVSGNTIAKLYWMNSLEERKYQSQPLAALSVFTDYLPQDWPIEGVATWICSLLSVATGRMISWNYSYIPSVSLRELKVRESWFSHTLQTTRFTAFTEDRGSLSIHGINETSKAIGLVEDVLNYVFKESFDRTEFFLDLATDYVYYASATSDLQHRCTLLCALAEDLFAKWKVYSATKIMAEVPKQERHQLLDLIQVEVEKFLPTILERTSSETDDEYQYRCTKFINRIRGAVSNNLSESYAHRLKALFQHYGWWTDTTKNDVDNMGTRIEAFVTSRNKLFHEHRFVTERVKIDQQETIKSKRLQEELIRETSNIELMIPLMFASILDYRGQYWDTVARNWRSMPLQT